jgi:hypothetical protein
MTEEALFKKCGHVSYLTNCMDCLIDMVDQIGVVNGRLSERWEELFLSRPDLQPEMYKIEMNTPLMIRGRNNAKPE